MPQRQLSLAGLEAILGVIKTPLGTFRTGQDDPPPQVGYALVPKWDMTGNNEAPPVYRGPLWLQFVLKAPDYHTSPAENPKEWRGRKWRVSRYSTQREVVGTAFAAVMAAMEHEVRECFTYVGSAVFGPHIPLDALVYSADLHEPDARA